MTDLLLLTKRKVKLNRLSSYLRYKSSRESKFIKTTTWLPFCRVSAHLQLLLQRRNLWYRNNGADYKITPRAMTNLNNTSKVLDRRRSHLGGTSQRLLQTLNLSHSHYHHHSGGETCHPTEELIQACKYH